MSHTKQFGGNLLQLISIAYWEQWNSWLAPVLSETLGWFYTGERYIARMYMTSRVLKKTLLKVPFWVPWFCGAPCTLREKERRRERENKRALVLASLYPLLWGSSAIMNILTLMLLPFISFSFNKPSICKHWSLYSCESSLAMKPCVTLMVSESSYNTAMLYHDYFCLLGYNVNFLE